jgi:hypothetical protein
MADGRVQYGESEINSGLFLGTGDIDQVQKNKKVPTQLQYNPSRHNVPSQGN